MPGRRERIDLFVSGTEGYHTYRIPALAVSVKGTLLAFCEGRKNSFHDSGQIDLLLKRSTDGGHTWSDTQLVTTELGMTCGNPCPVVDHATGTIWLPFCKNLAEGPQGMIIEGKAPRTVWMTRSDDDGLTWATPWEITADVKKPNWTWYATGPCHGIQMRSGRLVVPCDYNVGIKYTWEDPYRSHVIYSDDHGATWKAGEAPPGGDTNECAVAETADGALYLNCRNRKGPRGRAIAWSRDGGQTFCPLAWDDTLIEPVCQAAVARYTLAEKHDRNRMLFSNPASTLRNRMTLRLSYDEGLTWPVMRVLHGGPAAYSDLAVAPDMAICCLYENGENTSAYDYITLARLDLEWLTFGADRLPRP